jgi:ATP-dependent DNA helicase RecG
LERLHERGLIEGRSEKRGRVYILSGALYQRLKMQAKYVRAKGIEPEEMEKKVLDFMREHGKITRSDIADLCHISGPQASRLLQKISRQYPGIANGGGTPVGALYLESSINLSINAFILL